MKVNTETAKKWWCDLSDSKIEDMIAKYKIKKPILDSKIIEVYSAENHITQNNLTDNQKVFLFNHFFKNESFAGWRNIADSLLTKGKCIVAGNPKIWVGGIGNFIKIEDAEYAVGCSQYTFDLNTFLSSEWYKEIHSLYMGTLIEQLNDLQSKVDDLSNLSPIPRFEEGGKIIWDSGSGYDLGYFIGDGVLYNTYEVHLVTGICGGRVSQTKHKIIPYNDENMNKMFKKYNYGYPNVSL